MLFLVLYRGTCYKSPYVMRGAVHDRSRAHGKFTIFPQGLHSYGHAGGGAVLAVQSPGTGTGKRKADY